MASRCNLDSAPSDAQGSGGAHGEIRTHTGSRPEASQDSASANSATWALLFRYWRHWVLRPGSQQALPKPRSECSSDSQQTGNRRFAKRSKRTHGCVGQRRRSGNLEITDCDLECDGGVVLRRARRGSHSPQRPRQPNGIRRHEIPVPIPQLEALRQPQVHSPGDAQRPGATMSHARSRRARAGSCARATSPRAGSMRGIGSSGCCRWRWPRPGCRAVIGVA